MTPIEEIKAKIDILEFLKGYLDLKPAGKNWKAPCPFHKERSPSFMVSPDRGIWHCFGCGEGGDVFKFVMKYESLEFYEALKFLAEKAGVELRKVSPSDQREFGIIYDVNRAAADFFKSLLPSAPLAVEYLASRGLLKEAINDFEIGFAPNSWEDATLHLIKTGFDVGDIIRAGISVKTERGKVIDRFRGRIMFPLENTFGKVIGFSGRILPAMDTGDTAKYLNSPETPIFSKSRLLFGLSKAKEAIRESGQAVLMEGQMDVIMSHQDGVKFAVGTSGTALTDDQLSVLKRYTEKLVLNFDNDPAGKMAAERSVDLAYAKDFEVKVLDFSALGGALDGLKDPADIVKNHPGRLREIIETAEHAMAYYFRRYPVSDPDISERKKNVRLALQKISAMPSSVDRSYWLKQLSYLSGVRESDLASEIPSPAAPKTFARPADPASGRPAEEKKSRRETIAERLILLSLISDEARRLISEVASYLPIRYLRLYNGAETDSPDIRDELAGLSLKAGRSPVNDIEEETGKLIADLEIEALGEERSELTRGIDLSDEATAARYRELTERIEEIKKRR